MSNGDIFVGEVIGTAILILFGAGVVRRRHTATLQGEGRRAGSSSRSAGASACWPARTPRRRCPAGTSTRP